nr:putative ribonuclease H-like domain-containing protein [Tanacetum cinerariifolium]
YNGVPPPYTGNFLPPKPDLSGLEEFVNEPIVSEPTVKKPVIETREPTSADNPKVVRKNFGSPLIKDWISNSEDEVESKPKIKKRTVKPSFAKIEFVKSKEQLKSPRKTTVKKDKGVIDSGYSRHMTWNMSYLIYYEEIDGGYVSFGRNPKGGKITGKDTIKTGKLDFENVYFVRELKFNLFSVLQMCDKKNSVLFNDTECIVLSPNFKLIDESQVLLRVPRKNNMYSVDLKNIVSKEGLTCFFAKSTSDESKLWHRRLGHLNFKTMNKLVKENLVRGLPSKLFENNQDCVACQKGKQYKASCKSKTENSICLPLHLLHIDFFGPTFVKSLMKKMYCLVVTEDYSRFTWIFFLASKDETSTILKTFIIRIENLIDHKVKVIRCDNRTEFKNREMNQFCKMKGKFDGKADEGFFVGYSLNSKAFRVFNNRTRIVVENLHISKARMETVPGKDYILIPLWTANLLISQESKSSQNDGFQPSSDDGKKVDEVPRQESECKDQEKEDNVNNTNNVNVVGANRVNNVGANTNNELLFDLEFPALEDITIFNFSSDHEDDDKKADMNNMDTTI